MSRLTLEPKQAVLAAAIASLVTLVAGAWLVLGCWYPVPYWRASGVLGIAAYAVLAHLGLTALLWLPWRNRSKDADEVRADAAFLAFVILGAALLSLSFLFAGRPVALVFAVDRIALVRANEIRATELAFQSHGREGLRLSGPLQLVAARPSSDEERLNSIQLAMSGYDLHQRPSFWMPFETQRVKVLEKATRLNAPAAAVTRSIAGVEGSSGRWTRYLPLAGVKGEWAILLDDDLGLSDPVPVD
ncbi:hypothetical protein [Hydrogenophaga sp.]